MKRFLFFSIFVFHISFVFAQADSIKLKSKGKRGKDFKEQPSYIDANLYKVPRIQPDTAAERQELKKKLKVKTVDKPSFGPITADYPPDEDLALKDAPGVYFEKPHSVAWLAFTIPSDTVLTFDLIPTDAGDDIDFLLFKDETGNFLGDLRAHKTKPIRSNLARCDKSLQGKTGLSAKGKHNYEALGKNNPYSTPLKAKKGEHFFLAVDNYTHPNKPFTLFLHLRWPAFVKPTMPVKPPHMQPLSSVKLNIVVIDSVGKPIKTRLKIVGAVAHKVIDTNHVSKYSLTLQRRQLIGITAIATGYLLYHSTFRVPDTGNVFTDTLRLKPVRKNQSMVLQDIEFEPDQDVFLPGSQEPLSNLVEFMEANPTVHILIKGYVNDPQQINSSRYDMDLSEHRAVAVKKYLMEHGIDEHRMEWKGFGSNDMLYPNPKTWEEQQANRRVEIEVK